MRDFSDKMNDPQGMTIGPGWEEMSPEEFTELQRKVLELPSQLNHNAPPGFSYGWWTLALQRSGHDIHFAWIMELLVHALNNVQTPATYMPERLESLISLTSGMHTPFHKLLTTIDMVHRALPPMKKQLNSQMQTGMFDRDEMEEIFEWVATIERAVNSLHSLLEPAPKAPPRPEE